MLVYAVDNAKALVRLDYIRVGLVIVQVKGRGRVSKAGLSLESDGSDPSKYSTGLDRDLV